MTTSDKERELAALQEKQKAIDREPFRNLRIDDPSVLDCVQGREICGRCYKSRKFFCYTCYTPVIDRKYIPRVKLPIKVDIIKHAREIDGKSTAVHAAILASEDVTIYTYPKFPVFPENERVVLIFPSDAASTVEQLYEEYRRGVTSRSDEPTDAPFPITRAVFIDSTWHQTKAIYKDRRLRDLPCVILKTRISQFWRHQRKSPRWYLATVEAIHQFMTELHACGYGIVENYASISVPEMCNASGPYRPYSGQYDNLLYFFKYMYEKIHTIYDHEKLWAYKRPLL